MTDEAGFVGRVHELAELLDHAQRAAAGHGGLTLIRGEPGVGKTSLAEQVVAACRDLGFSVHWGTSTEDDEQPPFWVWTQVLRSVVPSIPPEQLQRQLGPAYAELGLLVPEYVSPLSRASGTADAQAQFVLHDAITRTLLAAGRSQPLLVVLDDLHLADRSSLRCLVFLARQLRQTPILAIGTHLDVDIDPESSWAATQLDLARLARSVELAGLSLAEIATLLAQTVPELDTAAVVADVLSDSGGNPLFARQVARLMAAEGRASRIPGSLREVLLRRLARFDENTLEVLRAAALMGRTVDVNELAAVCGLTLGELLDRLAEPLAARILDVDDGPGGRLSFSHGLMRTVVAEQLPAAARTELHLRAAEALERLQLADPAPYLARLAGHYVEAAAHGGVERAVRYSRAAAAQARGAYAYDNALRHLSNVRRLLEREPLTPPERLAEAILDVADVQTRSDGPRVAARTYREALDIADRTGSPLLYARAALGCCVDGTTGYHARPDLVALLREALSRLPDEELSLRSAILAELAEFIAVFDEGYEKASTAAREAVQAARSSGDDMTLSRALLAQLHVDWEPGTLKQRIDIVAELAEAARRRGDDEMTMHAYLNAYGHAIESVDRPAADALLTQITGLTGRLRTPRWTLRRLTSLGVMAVLDADFDRVWTLIEEVALLAERVPTRESQFAVIHMRAQLLDDLRTAADDQFAEQVRLLAREHGHHVWSIAALALSHAGRRADAREALRRGLEVVATYRNRRALLTSSVRLSEVAVREDEADAARKLYGVLGPYGDRVAVVGDGWAVLGPVALTLGRLATYLGDAPAAERHLAQADEVSRRLGARAWPTRVRMARARLVAATTGPQTAAADLAQARRQAATLGLSRILEHPERVTDEPPGPPSADPGPLTGAFLERHPDHWVAGSGASTVWLKDTKGLTYLAELLRRPGTERHVLDLVTTAAGDATARRTLGDAGPVLDARAKTAFRTRITELRERREEAELAGDDDTASAIEAEIDSLTSELAHAVGLGGRNRMAASAAERARLNVTRALRSSIARVGEALPDVGEHLSVTVRTGLFCAYEPEHGPVMALRTGPFSRR